MRWPELISLSLDSTTHCALSAATAHYIRSQIALSFCHATRHTPLLLYLLFTTRGVPRLPLYCPTF